jgi:hypothetical protein
MKEELDATPVTTPEVLFTVAAPVLFDDHVPPLLPLLVRAVVPPMQIASVPLMEPALGAAVTVTVSEAVALAQPPVPATV